jgi:hypothetical protein
VTRINEVVDAALEKFISHPPPPVDEQQAHRRPQLNQKASRNREGAVFRDPRPRHRAR